MMQTDQKSDPSTTRYVKDKVRYQITKKAEYNHCRVKIEHHDHGKRYTKYSA